MIPGSMEKAKNGSGLSSNGRAEESANRWLSEVQIQRFKAAFKPAPIPLSPFNVVIGRNGSGKSTLLEALQWLDVAIRRDAREASDRYSGTRDLINLRSGQSHFELALTWSSEDPSMPLVRYHVKVDDEGGFPFIAAEDLSTVRESGHPVKKFLVTRNRGERFLISGETSELSLLIDEPDRLALGLLGSARLGHLDPALAFLDNFWSRAVFLRLSPNRLANGSPATRKSFEPLLDEEGEMLPALLNELATDQRARLVEAIREILPGMRDVEVSKAELGRDTRVNYSLLERMPYRGRSGRRQFPIPSWMLSEGTRRVTAILALLVREPSPSLLCIEEIENGLDPWTVRIVLRHLESAADRGVQVILTTHSPWVLDAVPIDSILQVRRIEGDTRYEHFASRPEIAAFQPSVPAGTRYVQTEDELE